MQRYFRSFLSLGLLLSFAVGAAALAPLRLKLAPGDRYLLRHKIVTITEVPVPVPQKTTQTMTYEIDHRVLSVDEETGAGKVESRIKRIAVSASMGEMGQFRVDTNDDDAQQSATYHALIDKPFMMTITPLGQVVKVEGLSELVDAALDEGGAAGMNREQIEAIIGDEAIKSLYQSTHPMYPEDAADEWESETKVTMPMAGESTALLRSHRQEDVEIEGRPCVAIGLSLQFVPPFETQVTSMGPAEIHLTLKSMNSEGVVNVGADDGWPVQGKMTSSGVMDMQMRFGETPGMAAQMNIRSTAFIERLEFGEPSND